MVLLSGEQRRRLSGGFDGQEQLQAVGLGQGIWGRRPLLSLHLPQSGSYSQLLPSTGLRSADCVSVSGSGLPTVQMGGKSFAQRVSLPAPTMPIPATVFSASLFLTGFLHPGTAWNTCTTTQQQKRPVHTCPVGWMCPLATDSQYPGVCMGHFAYLE